MTKPLKPLCQFLSAWENYSENLKLVTRCDRAWVRPSIQMQTTLFQRRGAVSNIASKCPGPETRAMVAGCVRGFKGHVLSHSDSTASQTLSEVCSRGHRVPVPCSSVWTGFGPRALSRSAWTQLSHPLRASGMRVLNYLDDWLILAQSRDTPASHIDKLLRHLEFLRLCVNMRKSILAPSQSNVSGCVLRLKAVEMRARPPVCLPCAFSNWTVYYTCARHSFG